MVKLIEKKLKKKAKIQYKPKILLDPVNSLANTQKIKNLTGKSYKTGLSKGLDITIEWIKNYLKR